VLKPATGVRNDYLFFPQYRSEHDQTPNKTFAQAVSSIVEKILVVDKTAVCLAAGLWIELRIGAHNACIDHHPRVFKLLWDHAGPRSFYIP